MKKVTLTEVKKFVLANGGQYKKCKIYINGNDAYEVNGLIMTKREMIERYNLGEL